MLPIPHWTEALSIMRRFNDHYSMKESEQEALFRTLVNEQYGAGHAKLFLELGVSHGKTAAMLAYLCQFVPNMRYVGIDDYSLEGDGFTVRSMLADISPKAELIIAKTQEVEWVLPIDLLIVDAGHDAANVNPDGEKYVPLVVPGGLVAWHDYDFEETSPHIAIRKLADRLCEGWELVTQTGGLRILRKPLQQNNP